MNTREQQAFDALDQKIKADPEIQAIIRQNEVRLRSTRDKGGSSRDFQNGIRDQITEIARSKGYIPKEIEGGRMFVNPNTGGLELHRGWAGLSGLQKAAIIGAGAATGIGAAGALGAFGGLAGGVGGGAGSSALAGAATPGVGAGFGATLPGAIIPSMSASSLAGVGGLGAAGAAGTAAGTAGASQMGGLGKIFGKIFGKNGIDPTSAIMMGLSMFGGDDEENRPQSFKGTGDADPVNSMNYALEMLQRIGAAKELAPRHKFAPSIRGGAPAPVQIPGLPFQIGGGMGADFSRMLEGDGERSPFGMWQPMQGAAQDAWSGAGFDVTDKGPVARPSQPGNAVRRRRPA